MCNISNRSKDDLIKVFVLILDGNQLIVDNPERLSPELENAHIEEDEFINYELHIQWMSRKEYEALPEFEGF